MHHQLYIIYAKLHSGMTGIINIVDDNSNGIQITLINTSDSSDHTSSTPSYGYSYDLDLIFDFTIKDFIIR